MDAQIRSAEPGDVESVVAFGAAVVPPHYTPILGAAAAQGQLSWWTPGRIAPAVSAGRVLVAVSQESVVGVCETGEMDRIQVVWKLYVAPGHRGRSIGSELLRRSVEALPAGTEEVFVEHFAGNTRAGSFYEREGFAVVRTEPASSGDPDASVVWRRLVLTA